MIVALFAMAALAIDVSQAYAAMQSYRTATDAAALAGGQDLQGTTRAISGTDQTNARRDALESLARQLAPAGQPYVAPSGPNCDPSANIPPGPQPCQIPNTPYEVRITTPVAACVSCDPSHSVAVSVGNPNFQLSFSRALPGFDHWNVSRTSVAGLQFSASYALVTLRPPRPQPNGADQNLDDIDLNGGSGGGFSTHTTVNIINGDVGTNTYVSTNSDTMVQLLDGPPPAGRPTPNYRIYHYDQIGACANPTTSCDTWNKDITNQYPVGWRISQLLNDPQYLPNPIPRPTGSSGNLDMSTGLVGTSCDGTGGCSPTFACPGAPANSLPNGTLCYKPGVYPSVFKLTGSEPGAYLQSGVYFFDQGIQIGSGQSLRGGLQSNLPGVAIVVQQNVSGSNKGFDTASADVVDLNGGDPSCLSSCTRATPARDVNGNPVATPQGLAITIYVPRDPACFTGAVPQLCSDNQNNAVSIGGNSAVIVSGVIYGPSDNMTIASNSTSQTGVLGQIISWTVTYTGHATLNQEGPPQIQGGTLRLDAACTAPGTPCSP
jgi:hypothetical protein